MKKRVEGFPGKGRASAKPKAGVGTTGMETVEKPCGRSTG